MDTQCISSQLQDFAFVVAWRLEVPEAPVSPLNAHLQYFWLSLHKDPSVPGNSDPAHDNMQNQSPHGREKKVFSLLLMAESNQAICPIKKVEHY